MISKSWLFLELSIYSERVAKKGDTSSATCMPSLRAFNTPPDRSEPYDLRVHNRGCKTMFALLLADSAGSIGLGFGMES